MSSSEFWHCKATLLLGRNTKEISTELQKKRQLIPWSEDSYIATLKWIVKTTLDGLPIKPKHDALLVRVMLASVRRNKDIAINYICENRKTSLFAAVLCAEPPLEVELDPKVVEGLDTEERKFDANTEMILVTTFRVILEQLVLTEEEKAAKMKATVEQFGNLFGYKKRERKEKGKV